MRFDAVFKIWMYGNKHAAPGLQVFEQKAAPAGGVPTWTPPEHLKRLLGVLSRSAVGNSC